MGNSHSSETPRKAPQKLSKPRSSTQRTSTIGISNPDGEPAHFSNSYPVGRPISAVQPVSPPNVRHSLTGLGELPAQSSRSPVDRSIEREKRLSGIVRSNTCTQDYSSRHSLVAASVHSAEYQSRTRASSMVYAAGSRSLTGDRTVSFSSRSRRSSIQYELPILEPRSPMFPDPTIPQVPPIPADIMEAVEAIPRSPRMQPAGNVNIARNKSEASLYPPVRRRSMVQTPGVATRSPAPLTAKSSFRHSLPPSPSPSRRNSIDVKAQWRASMLPLPKPVLPETREGVVTPCEDDYKQLGGMKFGSLRVINASPAPSSVLDQAQDQARSTPDHAAGHSQSSRGVPLTLATGPGQTIGNADEPKIVQPKPTSPITSPVITTFDHQVLASKQANTLGKSSENVRTASPSAMPLAQSSQRNLPPHSLEIASKPTGYEDGLFDAEPETDHVRPEVLDVADVPHARADASSSNKEGGAKSSEKVTRSDSGFASTSSSNASGKPLSKTDSGYGSSLSLRSLRRSKSKSRTPSRNASSTEIQSHKTENDLDAASPRPKNALSPAIEDSSPHKSSGGLSVLSSGKSLGFSSNKFLSRKPSKSRDSSPPKPSSLSRPKSRGPQHTADGATPPTVTRESESKHAKLQRFWNSRRKSLPAQHAPTEHLESIPPSPAYPDVQYQEHNTYLSVRSRHAALRLEPSKDTLKTIFSVGSVELTQAQEAMMESPSGQVVLTESPLVAATVTVDEIRRPESRTARKQWARPTQSPPQHLKSRSSAPSFLKIDPSVPTSTMYNTSMRTSQTPPPLSMRRHSAAYANAWQQNDYPNLVNTGASPESPVYQRKATSRHGSHQYAEHHGSSIYGSPPYSAVEASHVGTMDFAYHPSAVGYAAESMKYRRSSSGQQMYNELGLVPQHQAQTVHAAQVSSFASQAWDRTTPSLEHAPSSYERSALVYPYAVEQRHQVGRRVASNPSMSVHHRRQGSDSRRQNYGQSPPYRILHSYDSPAYKNAPIWN